VTTFLRCIVTWSDYYSQLIQSVAVSFNQAHSQGIPTILLSMTAAMLRLRVFQNCRQSGFLAMYENLESIAEALLGKRKDAHNLNRPFMFQVYSLVSTPVFNMYSFAPSILTPVLFSQEYVGKILNNNLTLAVLKRTDLRNIENTSMQLCYCVHRI